MFDEEIAVSQSRNLMHNDRSLGVSYYETSDDEMPNNKTKANMIKRKNKMQSRLSQLSKFNLFALVELANAWLIIKTQNNIDYALQILNESIISWKILSEKAGTEIIAQDLLELLMSQIMDQKSHELGLEDDTPEMKELNMDETSTTENQPTNIPLDKIMAVSNAVLDIELENEGSEIKSHADLDIDLDNHTPTKNNKINVRSIICSKDFQTVMAITTLVPFIKSGIPRLSDFEVKKAKLIEKDLKRTSYSSKFFMNNLELRHEIYDILIHEAQQNINEQRENHNKTISHIGSQNRLNDKNENSNIRDHPEINSSNLMNNSISGPEIKLDTDKKDYDKFLANKKHIIQPKQKTNNRYRHFGAKFSRDSSKQNKNNVNKSNVEIYTVYNQKFTKSKYK